MRLNRGYIIGYIHWAWTGVTVYIPLLLLVILNIRIFKGLRKVKRNLNRHKRLEARAKASEVKNKKSQVECTIQVKVTNENGNGKSFVNFLGAQ